MKDIIMSLLEVLTPFVKGNYKNPKFWISLIGVAFIALYFFCSCTVSVQVAKKNGIQEDVRSEQSTVVDSVDMSNSFNRK